MRGYSRVEEDLDEYGYGYGEDEEASVEEEDPVQEYLELRQKLKEAARKKLANKSGLGLGSNALARDTKRSKLENFGSFFGPSRTVIAERVIQDSKSFLQTRQEAPRLPSSQSDSGKSERRPHNPVKTKVQKLKDTRDYSFLLSDDADIPKTAIVGRQIPNGTGERRPIAVNSQTRPGQNLLHKKPSTGVSVRPDSRRPERLAVPEHKKHNPVSSHGNGTSRLLLPKREPLQKTSSQRRPLQQNAHPKQKPKPARRSAEKDDDQAILEIRKMFGYNPNRYAGDDDDLSDMEADFRTIQMEEKRSAIIAREEDKRELMLIQEEEERERKLAKKPKMGQR